MSKVFLTGATGFLGMETLVRLLEAGDEVVALVRAPDDAAAQVRLDEVLTRLYDEPSDDVRDRVRAVAGDVTRPLPYVDAETVVHCAASIAFDLPLAEAHTANVTGTANVLELAKRMPSLRHLVHVSTAYVAGRHEGVFRETDLDIVEDFRNTYEATKHRAERLLAASELPITIVRPSIVVGDSHTGWTPAFNVLYWPLQAFARGLIDHVPARPDGIVDVVPVDYVADSIAWLVENESPQGTLALVAGERASTAASLIRLACEHFDRPAPRLVGADEHSLPEQAMVYVPYFDVGTRFDDTRARALLRPAGLEAPALNDYFAHLMEYAAASRWGRRPLTRAAVAA
jgi:nucleoside-diphosphate-sugar epimerase